MIKRIALAIILLATLVIAGAYVSAFLPGGTPAWAPWAMALGGTAVQVGVMMLGALRGERLGRLVYPFVATFVVLAGGFALVLLLPADEGPSATLWFGLPVRAAVLLYGVGLVPALIVPVAYALTFDEMILTEADLERVREAARARRDAVPAGAAASGEGEGA